MHIKKPLLPQNTSSKAWASQHAAAKTGMLGRETGFLLASSALALLHAAYTLVSWLVLPQLPFHMAHHAALALLWLLVAGCCSRASRRYGHRVVFKSVVIVRAQQLSCKEEVVWRTALHSCLTVSAIS
jgi:hypothetical protein